MNKKFAAAPPCMKKSRFQSLITQLAPHLSSVNMQADPLSPTYRANNFNLTWGSSKYNSWMAMGDPRTADWPLVASPIPTLMMSATYLLLVNWLPKVLKGRTLPVYYPVIAYNFALVLLNLYIVVELLLTTSHYRWTCNPVDYSEDAGTLRTARAVWWVYISKLIEMLDTFFFIAKGNYRQLSFLHMYHHSTIFILWWLGVKYVPGGNCIAGAILNSFIHIIMYSYYFLSAFGSRFKKYLWWKRYLTRLQLAQFAFCLVHACAAYQDGCLWPEWMYCWFISYQASFLVLFGNFYIVNYIKKNNDNKTKPSKNGMSENGLSIGIKTEHQMANGKKRN